MSSFFAMRQNNPDGRLGRSLMKMRGLAAKAVLLALCMPVLACAADCTLEYRFTANWDAQPRRFDVELLFDAGDRSATQIRSVREWAGVTDFERAIRDVRPGDPTITLSEGSEPGKTRKVVHPPKSRVSVRYAIVNDVENVDADTPMPHRDFYRNMLGASYFQLFGWAVLLLPEHLR